MKLRLVQQRSRSRSIRKDDDDDKTELLTLLSCDAAVVDSLRTTLCVFPSCFFFSATLLFPRAIAAPWQRQCACCMCSVQWSFVKTTSDDDDDERGRKIVVIQLTHREFNAWRMRWKRRQRGKFISLCKHLHSVKLLLLDWRIFGLYSFVVAVVCLRQVSPGKIRRSPLFEWARWWNSILNFTLLSISSLL